VRNFGSRAQPMIVGFKLETEVVVEHSQITIAPVHDRLRHDLLHFLRDDAHIGLAAAVIAEAIEAEAVVEMAEQDDIVLEAQIGPPTATSTSAAAGMTTSAAGMAAAATLGSPGAASASATVSSRPGAAGTAAAMRNTSATTSTSTPSLRRLMSLTAA